VSALAYHVVVKCRTIFPWRRRFRGARRYYSKLHQRAGVFSFALGETDWYDMHHVHFDFFGHGRRGVKHHREHLRALFTAFRRVSAQVASSGRPVQVFVGISPVCRPEEDALYIHTSNPNGSAFPYGFPDVSWDARPPAFLRDFVAGEPWEIGVLEREGKRWFVVVTARHREG
jgi:hypothetical protein